MQATQPPLFRTVLWDEPQSIVFAQPGFRCFLFKPSESDVALFLETQRRGTLGTPVLHEMHPPFDHVTLGAII